jgi:alpha-L-fucosidase
MAKTKTKTRAKAVSNGGSGDSRTAWFVHDRLGMFIHWGLYSLAARHEWVKHHERLTDEQYQRYFDYFDPDLYDPRTWARAARAAGMKYFVITTKHHEGFCLWDTKQTDYQATRTPAGRDLLKPMVQAFRDEGLKVGFYYSLLDWHHPEFPVDCHHPQRGDVAFREKTKGRDVRKYAAYMREQVRELLTGFGKIDIIWFDFSYPAGKDGLPGKGRDDWESEKLLALVRKLQPDILIDNRLDLPGSGDFVTPEQVQPDEAPRDEQGRPAVWEACQTFSGSWGYHRDESSWKDVNLLLRMLIDGVSKGGNLLLNVGPTARGEFDPRASERLEGLGRWMRQHSRSIYGCGPSEFAPPPDCRFTQNGSRLYLHLFSWPMLRLTCRELAGRVGYAQFLHDGSEVAWKETGAEGRNVPRFLLPAVRPDVEIPVIEILLK